MNTTSDVRVDRSKWPELIGVINCSPLSDEGRREIARQLNGLEDTDCAAKALVNFLRQSGKYCGAKNYIPICVFRAENLQAESMLAITVFGVSCITNDASASTTWAKVLPKHILGPVDLDDFRSRIKARLKEVLQQVSEPSFSLGEASISIRRE